MQTLKQRFDNQKFANDYVFVDGVAMHAENPEHFHIPPDVIKRHVRAGQFVELRIDSPRFSVHEEASQTCTCPSCNGELKKPILRHAHPASLVPLPTQPSPSRGWGEDFWVRVVGRTGAFLQGTVDNPLVESRLHGLSQGDEVVFHEDQILAIHEIHRHELVAGMSVDDLKQLAQWLAENRSND